MSILRDGADPNWQIVRARSAAAKAGTGPRGHGISDSDAALRLADFPPEFAALARRFLARQVLTHECVGGPWCRDQAAHMAEAADLGEWLDELGLREPESRLVRTNRDGTRVKYGERRIITKDGS